MKPNRWPISHPQRLPGCQRLSLLVLDELENPPCVIDSAFLTVYGFCYSAVPFDGQQQYNLRPSVIDSVSVTWDSSIGGMSNHIRLPHWEGVIPDGSYMVQVYADSESASPLAFSGSIRISNGVFVVDRVTVVAE